jgi:small subunit ribosomal protein S2
VATGDTNVDPDEIDHIIPANDDAIRSIRLLCQLIADACLEGQQERASRAVEPEPEVAITAEPEYDESASDELVAALAGGAALTFEPDADDEDLLPGARPPLAATDGAPPPAEASPEEIAAELAREAAEKEETATAG